MLYLALRTVWAVALTRATVRARARAGWAWGATAADACASVLTLAWWHPAARPVLGAPALVAWEIWGVAPPLLAGAALSFMV